ncbi:MAG TPA: hypothetical protein VG714_08865 [Acidobacteriaceae bacterium]|nr:hypothetical protein [Acidobacteriaceae bacterium]
MSPYRSHCNTGIEEQATMTRAAFAMDAAAPAALVNRTHRVVRHRASVMQAQRSYMRSLLLPMGLCSILLTLAVFAIWSGMYQSTDAAEAIQDVASLASSDTNNHLVVAMLWFVPLTLIVLVAVWVRHIRSRESESTR